VIGGRALDSSGSSSLGWGGGGGSCEDCYEPLGSIKRREFVD
jgi:hypothetical protein